MKHPALTDAIQWIVDNDDNEWLTDDEPIPSVTACMVASLWNCGTIEIITMLKNAKTYQSRIFKYNPQLHLIRNTGQLPKGSGCRYLLVIPGLTPNEFIAKCWKRKIPQLNHNEQLIDFA